MREHLLRDQVQFQARVNEEHYQLVSELPLYQAAYHGDEALLPNCDRGHIVVDNFLQIFLMTAALPATLSLSMIVALVLTSCLVLVIAAMCFCRSGDMARIIWSGIEIIVLRILSWTCSGKTDS